MNEQEIFHAALNIANPAGRAAYLFKACGGDTTMQQAVESLLAAHQRDDQFLDIPAIQQIDATIARDPNAPSEMSAEHRGEINLTFLQASTQPGSLGRLGHYEVQEIIGRGGYGIVLKAFDDILHRTVAIKVMAPEIAVTSPARKRFLREARAAAAIQHENVISIHAVEDQPIPFLVMEYIAGPTLQQRLDGNGPFELSDVLRIGHQIASGLEAAHAMGIIHRDIKPCNILLEKGRDRVKITDFGLARAGDDASRTQSGAITGTPMYMSPEQAQGHTVDARTDLFSLGSVLYVMSSGRPPFRASTTLAVLNRVVKDQPRPIREVIPDLPDWLATLIAKLHAKNPEERYTSATEVARQFAHCEKYLQNPDRTAVPSELLPSTRPPASTSRRSFRIAAAVAASLFFALALCEATGITDLRSRGKPPPSPEVASNDNKPAVVWPYAKDFPGTLAYHETFDDPKTTSVFQGTRHAARFAIENGIYSIASNAEDGPRFFTNLGSPMLDEAFLLRLRLEHAVINVSFRVRNTATRGNWLYLRIDSLGRWTFFRNDMTHEDGQRSDKTVVLAESVAPDPILVPGQWITVAAQVSGDSYELWLNGRSVASGSNTPAEYDEPSNIKYAIQVAAWPNGDGVPRIDLDDIAIWALPTPVKKP